MRLHHNIKCKGLERCRFLLHPPPYEDELLSSWLVRLALLHRFNPVTFVNLHFPSIYPDFWSRDVDVFWGEQPMFLEMLSYKSRLPVDTLKSMTLKDYEGRLTEKILCNTRNKLILPLVKRGRLSKGKGLRFCPKCLAEDAWPYFRKQWRLSFVTTCLRHECFLCDRCPQCGAAINPQKLLDSDSYCKCYRCGTAYTKVVSDDAPVNSYGMSAQRNLLATLESGWFEFENNLYHSLTYFPAFNQMSKLIHSFGLREAAFDHDVFSELHNLPKGRRKSGQYTETLPIEDQYLLCSASEYLLGSLERMKVYCDRNFIGKTELTHSMAYIPYWYANIVDKNDHTTYMLSVEEVRNAIIFLKSKGQRISAIGLSKLLGSIVDKRKRSDIARLLVGIQEKD